MGEFVNYEVSDNGVATLRLDRPKVNALNEQVATEIGEAVDALAEDESARAVVVWGGERVFAAGADIKEMASQDTPTMYRYIGQVPERLHAARATAPGHHRRNHRVCPRRRLRTGPGL